MTLSIADLYPERLCTADALSEPYRHADIALSHVALQLFLNPLVGKVGKLVVNTEARQYRGWRDEQGWQAAGSFVGSDHTLLSLNAQASGACDVNSPAWKAPDLFREIAALVEGRYALAPRVLIYEHAKGVDWIHVSWPAACKQDDEFRRFAAAPQLISRPPYPLANGKPWRYWRIIDGGKREPVTALLSTIEGEIT